MMKFFRKHKKAVSPVIAVMLLVAVAVAAVGAYFIWFRSFQTQQQGAVQDATGDVLGTGLQVLSINNDEAKYYIVIRNTMNKSANVSSISISGMTSPTVSPASTEGIASGASKTYTVSATNFETSRATPRTITINYFIGNVQTDTGTTVHSYADA